MPDNQFALEQYRKRAGAYDLELAAFEPIRRQAVARLELREGDTVLDVGCGTGLSFALIQRVIGPQGRIVGIEQSPDMLAKARARVARHAWSNVVLLNASADLATIPCQADGALFHFTHDILMNDDAIGNVVASLRPGARVVAAGLQWAAPWAWATNLFVLAAAMHSVTSLQGLGQPWSRLEHQVGKLEVSSSLMGGVYVASGELVH